MPPDSLSSPAPPPDGLAQFRLFRTSAEAWEAVRAQCADARLSIDFEQYILGDDEIGTRLLDLFARKAAEGVQVRLLLDAHGSSRVRKSGAWRRVTAAGGAVRFYNRLGWHSLLAWPPRIHRDHRKTVVVDDRTAFLGGICFTDRMRDWRDTFLRLDESRAVGPIQELFRSSWERAAREELDRGRRGESVYRQYEAQAGGTRYLVNAPDAPISRDLYGFLLERIRTAETSLRLTTPYLAPENRLLRYLRDAAARGVEVTLILPGESDHPTLDILNRAFARRLTAAGCRLRYYNASMMHAKLAVVDGALASVSSHNLDRLSCRFNLENGLVSDDPVFVAAVEREFAADLAESAPDPPPPGDRRPLLEPLLRMARRLV
jgi:cardiolipin synthase